MLVVETFIVYFSPFCHAFSSSIIFDGKYVKMLLLQQLFLLLLLFLLFCVAVGGGGSVAVAITVVIG